MNRLEAMYMSRNPASGRVMEKSGMTYEGEKKEFRKIRGTFEDIKFYGILRSDWIKIQGILYNFCYLFFFCAWVTPNIMYIVWNFKR